MITLDGIIENLIAEIAIFGVSAIIAKFAPNLLFKKSQIKDSIKFDALSLSILFTLVSIFNLVLNLSFWNKPNLTTFLTISSIGFGILTGFIYNNQCPSCKKFIRAKNKIDEKIIKKFTEPWKYQPMKIFLYSNGNIWKKIPVGREITRIENWITKQEFWKCNYCGNLWDSGHFNVNLDESTRPSSKIVKTDKKDPNEFSI